MSRKFTTSGILAAVICAATSFAADTSKPKKAGGDSVASKNKTEGAKPAAAALSAGSSASTSTPAAGGAPATGANGTAPEVTPISIPLVEGFPSFGVRLPDLDEQGKLRSFFSIGSVSRVNEREVEIKDSVVETYAADGSREMSIELPEARLDRMTRVLVAHVPVTIRRDEFEVTGATMEFNTVTREGGLGGPVRMLLYNLDSSKGGEKEAPKPEEVSESK